MTDGMKHFEKGKGRKEEVMQKTSKEETTVESVQTAAQEQTEEVVQDEAKENSTEESVQTAAKEEPKEKTEQQREEIRRHIEFTTYFENCIMNLSGSCYNDKLEMCLPGPVKVIADLIFDLFGKKVSENLISAYNGERGYEADYYLSVMRLERVLSYKDAQLLIFELERYSKDKEGKNEENSQDKKGIWRETELIEFLEKCIEKLRIHCYDGESGSVTSESTAIVAGLFFSIFGEGVCRGLIKANKNKPGCVADYYEAIIRLARGLSKESKDNFMDLLEMNCISSESEQ